MHTTIHIHMCTQADITYIKAYMHPYTHSQAGIHIYSRTLISKYTHTHQHAHSCNHTANTHAGRQGVRHACMPYIHAYTHTPIHT